MFGQVVGVGTGAVILGQHGRVKTVPGKFVRLRLWVEGRRRVRILDRRSVGRELPLGAKVHLARAIGAVAVLPQHFHQRQLALGQAHAVGAQPMDGRIAPGGHAAPVGRADRIGRKHTREAYAPGRQRIDVARIDHLIAVTAQRIRAQLIGCDEEDVGKVGHRGCLSKNDASCEWAPTLIVQQLSIHH